MKKIAGRKSEDDAKIDLTPMLDVVFILLIFFVVTATFLSETSISAASSDNNNNESPPEDNDKKNILFEIGANNEIILNGNPRMRPCSLRGAGAPAVLGAPRPRPT